MLFTTAVLARIVSGEVTVQFRRWRKSPPRPGSTQLTQLGVVSIDAVDVIDARDITEADARRSGAGSRAELLASLPREGTLLRVGVSYLGPDPRVALRSRRVSDDLEADRIRAALTRLDRSAEAPWTRDYLRLIRDAPGTVARVLAERAATPTVAFKRRVRSLKGLGLTESLDVGYRLSPRGADVLSRLERDTP